MKIEFWWRQIFKILIIHKPSLWARDVPQNLGPIGSAVLNFIGYKQTNRQTSQIYIKIACLNKLISSKPNFYIFTIWNCKLLTLYTLNFATSQFKYQRSTVSGCDKGIRITEFKPSKSSKSSIFMCYRVSQKHGNSVTNSISSLLWISIVIPNFKSQNIVMSARVYFMKRVKDC